MEDDGKILITGGSGFVGRHLAEELRTRQHPFYCFGREEYDLTDAAQAEAVFRAHRDARTVIHLASYQAAADFPAKHTAEQLHINGLIHLNVLESWHNYTPQAKLIAIGTSCAYPGALTSLREEHYLDGEVHGSVYAYAFSKRLLYTGIRAYNDQYGMNGSYLIPATMYGEYDDFDVLTAHVCGALIGKFVRAVKEGLSAVEIWGDGTQQREFMYVKEFVRVLLTIMNACDRDVVNVGPGRGTSIRGLALMIAEAAGYGGELHFNSSRYVGIKEKYMDTSKLQNVYNCTVSNEHAGTIAKVVRWYWQHYEQLKDRRKFCRESGERGDE